MKSVIMKKAIYSIAALALLCGAPQAMAAVEDASLEELRQLIMKQQQQLADQARAIETLQKDADTKENAGNPDESLLGLVKSGNDKVNVTLYGQVNRAIMSVDDGEESEVYHVDNDNSSTRIGLKGSVQATEDLSAGFKFETEFESNSSNSVSQDTESVSPSFKERHMDVYLKSNQFGKLSIGQGDTASNGTSEIDLSGTTVIGFSDQPKLGGAIKFYDADTESYSSTDIGDVFANIDGLSRKDRLRYDTPSWKGFSVAVSTVEKNGHDGAIRYNGKIGPAKLAAGVAFAKPGANNGDADYQVNGSASVLFDNGFNLTFAAGKQDLEELVDPATNQKDPVFCYGKVGYIAEIFDIGSTAFAIDYSRGRHIDQADDTAKTVGVMAVQKLSQLNTEFFASYRQFSLDRDLTDMEDIDVVMGGARIKF